MGASQELDYSSFTGMLPYAGIDNIDEAEHYDAKSDLDLILQVGEIFIKENVHDIVGLCLLHTHFKLEESEILVEAEVEGETISKPIETNMIKGNVSPMMWRLTPNTPPLPLHWRADENPHWPRIQRFLNSPGVIHLEKLLCRNINRFGIIKISDQERRLLPGHVLLEETFLEERLLISSATQNAKANSVQTAWYFSPPEMKASDRYCDTYSRKECNVEVTRTCPTDNSDYVRHLGEKVKSKHLKSIRNFHDRVSK